SLLHLKVARVTGRQAPHTFTSGGAQVLGLIFKELPTDSADEAVFQGQLSRRPVIFIDRRSGKREH
ncbi:MAG: hypothetical protein PHI97_19365, partial [Desulfobulbus sp.]|nr:hypothetical protein [Desulfobulbus sp.]